jgi:hypothetical protein
MADLLVLAESYLVFDLGDEYPSANSHPDGPGLSALGQAGSRLFIGALSATGGLWLVSQVSDLKLDEAVWRGVRSRGVVTNVTHLLDELGLELGSLAARLEKPKTLSAKTAELLVAELKGSAPPSPAPKPARPAKPPRELVFKRVLVPKRMSELDATQKKQVAKLDWLELEKELKNVELFVIEDAKGKSLYDLLIHAGDDGVVFRAGTTKAVASFSQGGVSECDSDSLEEALEAGYDAFLAQRQKGKQKGKR